jgi:ATP-dependent Clp protease ATP-binding subunit ClpA
MAESRDADRDQLPGVPLERLNPRSRTILRDAAAAASRNGDHHIGSEHLLLAIVNADGGPAWSILSNLGQIDAIRTELESLLRYVAEERR